MIPLVVCRIDEPQWKLLGSFILLTAFVLGYEASKIRRFVGARWALAVFVIGALLPVAMMLGLWPFDGRWNYDCGFTPDPNIWVTMSSLAFPIVASLSFLLFDRRKRK